MKKEDRLIQDVKDHLDQSIEDLDPGIVSKITRARYTVLEKQKSKWITWGIPITGIASTAALILIAFNLFFSQNLQIKTEQLEMVEILSSEQNLELFENLEFYAWLAENPEEHLGS